MVGRKKDKVKRIVKLGGGGGGLDVEWVFSVVNLALEVDG